MGRYHSPSTLGSKVSFKHDSIEVKVKFMLKERLVGEQFLSQMKELAIKAFEPLGVFILVFIRILLGKDKEETLRKWGRVVK